MKNSGLCYINVSFVQGKRVKTVKSPDQTTISKKIPQILGMILGKEAKKDFGVKLSWI